MYFSFIPNWRGVTCCDHTGEKNLEISGEYYFKGIDRELGPRSSVEILLRTSKQMGYGSIMFILISSQPLQSHLFQNRVLISLYYPLILVLLGNRDTSPCYCMPFSIQCIEFWLLLHFSQMINIFFTSSEIIHTSLGFLFHSNFSIDSPDTIIKLTYSRKNCYVSHLFCTVFIQRL